MTPKPFNLWLLLGMTCSLASGQQGVRFSLSPAQLSVSNCVAHPGTVPIPLETTNLNLELVNWTAQAVPENRPGEFLLTFTKPAVVGTIITYGAETIAYALSNEWKSLPAGEETGRALQIIPFPKGDPVESIKITVLSQPAGKDEEGQTLYRATLPFATLIPVSIHRVSGNAIVTVSSVEKAPGAGSGKPEVLLDGAVAEKGDFFTANRQIPISPESPEWILLSWKEPQTIRGLFFLSGNEGEGLGESIVEIYTGSGDPRQAKATNDWQLVTGQITAPGAFRSNKFFVASQSVTGRGLRLTSTGGVNRIGLGEVVALAQVVDSTTGGQ